MALERISPLRVQSLGATASSFLSTGAPAKVLGVTSSGVFLDLPPAGVVFLTPAAPRGPLTVNIVPRGHFLPGLSPGDPVFLSPQGVAFPSIRLSLSLAGAPLWAAPPPPGSRRSPEGLPARLEETVRWIQVARPVGAEPTLLDDRSFSGELARLQRSLAWILGAGEMRSAGTALDEVGAAARNFLGRGRGLTPAGDDLLLGVLLLFNRWGALLWPAARLGALLEPLNARILALAGSGATTTLSACLLACAAQGQADERLVAVLDGLVTGAPGPEACARLLLGWGSSSGADTLAGIRLACNAGALHAGALRAEAVLAQQAASG